MEDGAECRLCFRDYSDCNVVLVLVYASCAYCSEACNSLQPQVHSKQCLLRQPNSVNAKKQIPRSGTDKTDKLFHEKLMMLFEQAPAHVDA